MKKNIKAIIAVLVVVVLAVAAYFGSQNGKSSEKTTSSSSESSSSRTITVGTSAQTFPNTYKDDDGNLTGFDVEITEAIAKELGYKVNWEIIGDVPGLLTAVGSGKIDTVANAVTVLPERKELYNFSDTVAYYAAEIAVKKDSSYNSVADLDGKTVSATLGSSNITLLEAYDPAVNIKSYDDRSAVFSDANSGAVDGVLNQKQFLQKTIEEQGLDLRIIDEVIGWNEAAYPFAKTKDGEVLQSEFNTAIKKLLKDGTFAEISEKYFNENITEKTDN